MLLEKNFYSSREVTLKYFIPQRIGSIILLFSFLLSKVNGVIFFYYIFNFIFIFGLFIKIGIFPFHLWFLRIIIKLDSFNIFILITVQKLIPFIFLIISLKLFILIFRIISIFFSTFFSFYQTSVKKILGYSSIFNTRWLLYLLLIRKVLWLLYFIFYLLIRGYFILVFNKINILNLYGIYFKSEYFGFIFFC